MVSSPRSIVGDGVIVKFNVTILSQPAVVCNVSEYIPVDVYVFPYHIRLSQAMAVVSPVAELFIVKLSVTTLSQAPDVDKVSLYVPDVV